MSKRVHIYGVFSPDGSECLYVGQSVDPLKRMPSHRARMGAHCHLRTLKMVNRKTARRAEGVTIRRYKWSGQAQFNRNLSGGPIGVLYPIRLDHDLVELLRKAVRASGLPMGEVMRLSVAAGLPILRRRLRGLRA